MPTANSNIGDFATTATLETFGFLPRFAAEETRAQIAYIIAQGWTPAIEHERPDNAFGHYWTMWKLPMFGERDVANVLAELEACRRAYPGRHVRLIGYDSHAQTQGACFVVFDGRT